MLAVTLYVTVCNSVSGTCSSRLQGLPFPVVCMDACFLGTRGGKNISVLVWLPKQVDRIFKSLPEGFLVLYSSLRSNKILQNQILSHHLVSLLQIKGQIKIVVVLA